MRSTPHDGLLSLSRATVAVGVDGNAHQAVQAGVLDDKRELYWRMAVPLTLVLVSTDLLAMNLRSSPAMLDAVRDIQLQSQKLLEAIRNSDSKSSCQDTSPEKADPSVASSEN